MLRSSGSGTSNISRKLTLWASSFQKNIGALQETVIFVSSSDVWERWQTLPPDVGPTYKVQYWLDPITSGTIF